MATNASAIESGFSYWFREFLKRELAPYPGRGLTVARMVIAATLTMILIMTFRIPGGAVGALYAFLISRESLYATFKSAWTIVVSDTAGIFFVLGGAVLFADQPVNRFLWFAGSLLVVFFVLRTLRNFVAATGFAIVVTSALPLWQSPASAESHVEASLWVLLSVGTGTAVTVAVEVIFRALHTKDELIEGLENRWLALTRLLNCPAENQPISLTVRNEMAQYAMVGVSGLRRMIARSGYDRQYRERMTAVVSLTGRLADIGSTLAELPYAVTEGDQQRAAALVRRIDEIRRAIAAKQIPPPYELPLIAASGIPLLPELERTVVLISSVFSGAESVDAYVPSILDTETADSFFVHDAFTNYEHSKFALRGCLAATLCYFVYSVLDWQGLATSVTTCVLTALTNIGASRQKQLLRLTGAAAGGFIFGVGSQVFLLPNMDSITEFTLLFAAVTAVSAWFATASTRLSYFGLQLALAFYLINLQEFTIQTSLSIARDRVVGVFLGLFFMWIAFDQIWAKRAAKEMVNLFTANVHLVADLAALQPGGDPQSYIKRIRALRNTIYANFLSVNTQADAVPFEFGRGRAQHMEVREHIRSWQPSLRTLYLMLAASAQHRIFGAGADLPQPLLDALDRFNQECARMLNGMAGYLEGKVSAGSLDELPAQLKMLDNNLTQAAGPLSGLVSARAEGLSKLAQQTTSLLEDLVEQTRRVRPELFVKT